LLRVKTRLAAEECEKPQGNCASWGRPESHEEFSSIGWSLITHGSFSKNLDILAFFWNRIGCWTAQWIGSVPPRGSSVEPRDGITHMAGAPTRYREVVLNRFKNDLGL
jgi:hypothetical protein